MISLNDLNPEQRAAAMTVHGPLLILAGAGSGKTRTVTYRIAHMLQDHGIPAREILAVTFTNKAAKEMQERVSKLVPPALMKGITLSTFHSLGHSILRQDCQLLGLRPHFTIYDTSDQLAVISEALRHYQGEKSFDRKIILTTISELKNRGIGWGQYTQTKQFDQESPYHHAAAFVYQYYEEKLHFYNAIDFDDLLLLTVQLLQKNPAKAQEYSQKFRYIMIDEYQDTNTLQFQLIEQLTSTHHNICVVGDDDQSIYAFRGADITNILSFEKFFPETKVIKLEQNYRSTRPILDLANAVIGQNKQRKQKTLWSSLESPEIPQVWKCTSTEEESESIVASLQYHHQKHQIKWHEMAVIYRSNTQIPPLEDALRLANIPYEVIGGQKFYEKKEIKDLVAYLCLIHNPYDEIALRRILNVPARGIGQVTLNHYLQLSQNHKMPLLETFLRFPLQEDPKKSATINEFTQMLKDFRMLFREKSLSDALTDMVQRLHFMDYITKTYHKTPKQASRRQQDVLQLIQSAHRFAQKADPHPLKSFLEKLILADMQENETEDQKKELLPLMTMHSAKGLEFKIVYLLGAEEGTMPHKKCLINDQDIEEERRLFYVGVTRAQEKLIMTYCQERVLYGKNTPRHISRFLHTIPKSLYTETSPQLGINTQAEAKDYLQDLLKSLSSPT